MSTPRSRVETRSHVRPPEITVGASRLSWFLPPITQPEFVDVMVEMNELAATSWLPMVPHDPRSFKFDRAGLVQSINFSSLARHPAENEGKKANFFPEGNIEEPS